MAKAKQYQFSTEAVTVVTPVAETLFMCLVTPNEYTDTYGGTLLFKEDALNTTVKFKAGKGKEARGKFQDIVDNLVSEAVKEYKAGGKKCVKVDKLVPHTDQDDNETEYYELKCKNQEQPRILNKDRTVEKDFTTQVGNGSTMKAQLYLKPYVMQGKVGVTAYLSTALLLDVIEYGNNDLFDDDDFDDTSVDMDDVVADDETEDDDY